MTLGLRPPATRKIGLVGAAALVIALAQVPLSAQSASDYRLPGIDQTRPNPNVQGPVDSDVPVVRGPAPRPSPTQQAVPIATPSSAPSTIAPRTAAPVAAPPRATRADQPAPVRTSQPPITGGEAFGFPPLTTSAPDVTASPTSAVTPPPAILTPAPDGPAPLPTDWRSYWPFAAAVLVLLLAWIIALAWRRRHTDDPVFEFERPVVKDPAPQPLPIDVQPAEPPAVEAEAPIRLPQGIAITLEARRLSASLMATTLSYRLTLTNRTGQPLSALAIEGDMIAAHASLPPERQIASSAQRLELRHALVSLAPGDSAEFSGDLRLPLSAITPIRAGDAAYFVPLARLRIEASTAAGIPLVEAQTFVIGELAERPGAPLRPFRLDLGPRNYQNIGQRAVN